MAKQGIKTDRAKVNSTQDYEISHVAQKMGVSTQQVVGAKRAREVMIARLLKNISLIKPRKNKRLWESNMKTTHG